VGSDRLTGADVGAWLFTCHPRGFGDLDAARVDGWCARPTYRLDLVLPGQPALLWVSGSAGADPEPGIWMVGRTTGEVDRVRDRPRVGLVLEALAVPVPREVLRADPRTARMEVLRSAQTANPSVVTPAEYAAIVELLAR
jgi:hypothetical protein